MPPLVLPYAGHDPVLDATTWLAPNATVLNGAVIGSGSLVAAGSVVLEGTIVPPSSLVAGVPGKVRRTLTAPERARIVANAEAYERLVVGHRAATRGV